MNNAFEAHNIAHLSPSSINAFAGSPAKWVAERLLGFKSPMGASAHRGTATEDGILHGLTTPKATVEECIEVAKAKFNKLAALCGDRDQEGAGIPGYVANGLNELRAYGEPSDVQGKVVLEVPDLGVPILGFYDFMWQHHGILTDLKTTKVLPSKIKISHARQVGLYAASVSDNFSSRLTYVAPKKAATYGLEDPKAHYKALCAIAFTVKRFLALSKDPHELAQLVVPDLEHNFYWTSPNDRETAFRIWGV